MSKFEILDILYKRKQLLKSGGPTGSDKMFSKRVAELNTFYRRCKGRICGVGGSNAYIKCGNNVAWLRSDGTMTYNGEKCHYNIFEKNENTNQ